VAAAGSDVNQIVRYFKRHWSVGAASQLFPALYHSRRTCPVCSVLAAAALAGFTVLVTLVLALVLKRGGVADVR
jgi:hypothetical protein